MDWGKLPDFCAVALLATAFAAVARRNQSPVFSIWLTGWVMIALHFAAFILLPLPAPVGLAASVIGLFTLAWAGILFGWASVPYRHERTVLWNLGSLFTAYTLYVALVTLSPGSKRALIPAALLFGVLPLAIALASLHRFTHPLRWMLVVLHGCLSIFLLFVQGRPGGADLALNAVFFTIYFSCCLHFWISTRRVTTGAFITIAGFFAWASVFVFAPATAALLPAFHLETEVWNLPKYVVAVGMILLVLEDQIEHNKHLALHDELTGLPNRRLFQDRLLNALERARRTGSHAALLLIDLDHFKQVNDTVGHHVGDLLLKRVGETFAGRVRRSDTVARTGGDEFSVILEEPTSREDAECVSRSLIQLLRQPFELEGHTVTIGASIGVAVFPEDAPGAEPLRILADLRMYARKHGSTEPEFKGTARPPVSHPVPVIEIGTGFGS